MKKYRDGMTDDAKAVEGQGGERRPSGRRRSPVSGLRGQSGWSKVALLGVATGLVTVLVQKLYAEDVPPDDPPPPIGSLKGVTVPGPNNQQLAALIQDKKAAIELGKALFWDVRVGSDSKTACASCHFQAGADNRITNQINPGLLAGDKTFQVGGALAGPNYTLKPDDFPFTKFADVNDVDTKIADANDVVSSQGVFGTSFNGIISSNGMPDSCSNVNDAVFHGGLGFNINGVNTRRVEPRNAPTVINSVFNFRNFWDGRANNVFNGGDPFGLRNPAAMVWRVEGGVPKKVKLALPSSSLASQADGPPLSGFEMSCEGRAFVHLGKRLLPQNILNSQTISSSDSVLGSYALMRPTYSALIRKAFRSEYWSSTLPLSISGQSMLDAKSMDAVKSTGVQKLMPNLMATQMEANFALFFGLAVQLYEATLVSDDSPFDRYADGDTTALTDQQLRGMALFQGKGRCINCHGGPEFTNASFANVINQRIERMVMGDGGVAVYDNGFYNIGVRPTQEDLGVGGTDPFGNPLSETLMAQQGKFDLLGNGFDPQKEPVPQPGERTAVNGAFKTPTLRNVELTGPFFHNGGMSTLMQVVDFYNRGGDFANANKDDLDPDIQRLGLSEYEKQDLVAFLLALSDDRVRYRKAPFDHPSLCVPDGHKGGSTAVAQNGTTGQAIDLMKCLPAVGAKGDKVALQPFLGLSQFSR